MTSHPGSVVLRSVNVGAIRDVAWRGEIVRTGIWKQPVAGPVAVRGVNLVGDDQADRTVHGGPDKAVYAYAVEDYAYWAERETFAVYPGLFGENLTTEGIDLSSARAGDRWRVGTTLLEVAQPRLPCYKLGIRVDDNTFLKRFQAAHRPGAYFRIITAGVITAGDSVAVVSRPDHQVTMALMAASVTDRAKRAAVRAAPQIPAHWRE
ncbi:MAG: MOSC domain-containing protein [Acidobacteriota bacterium]